MYSKELLKGTLRTIVLKLLAEKSWMYGYEITQHVKQLTQGRLLITEGALYPTLHKMQSEGLLHVDSRTQGRRVRKYYGLTPEGQAAVQDRLREWNEFLLTMQLVFNPKQELVVA